jgi:hypothetical protein
VNYLARSRPEAEQAAFIVPFQEILRRGDGNEPIELDEAKRREAIGRVVDTVTEFGEGSSRGTFPVTPWLVPRHLSVILEIEGFFNLLFAHFLTLFDLESAETRKRVDTLLQTLTSSPTESAIKYRTCDYVYITRNSVRLTLYTGTQTSSTRSPVTLLFDFPCTQPCSPLPARMMSWMSLPSRPRMRISGYRSGRLLRRRSSLSFNRLRLPSLVPMMRRQFHLSDHQLMF